MNLADYFRELSAHDWFYAFSDDSRVYKRGMENSDRLTAIKRESENHARMYQAFDDYHFSGNAYGTPKAPKPSLENFL